MRAVFPGLVAGESPFFGYAGRARSFSAFCGVAAGLGSFFRRSIAGLLSIGVRAFLFDVRLVCPYSVFGERFLESLSETVATLRLQLRRLSCCLFWEKLFPFFVLRCRV